jgi:hypothetical protein
VAFIEPLVEGELVVRLDSSEILRLPEPGSPIQRAISRPLALALEQLSRHGSLSFPQFAESVLEARAYDARLHDHRIYNVLNRLRRHYGEWLAIQTRRHRIYASGHWERVRFVHPSPHAMIRESIAWREFLQPAEPPRLTLAQLRARFPGGLTRPELEQAFGVSRSGAVRLLAQMKRHKWIEPMGRGKRIRYEVLPTERTNPDRS